MKKVFYLLISVFFLFHSPLWAGEIMEQEIALSKSEQAKVFSGEIVLREIKSNREHPTFEAIGVFEANIERVYKLLGDYALHSQFMPNVTRAEVIEKTDHHLLVNYTLGLPMGQSKRYRLKITTQKSIQQARIEWQLVDWPGIKPGETIRDTQGYWLLKPSLDDKTLALYHVYTDPGHIPFGFGWIVDYLSKESIPDVLINTRKYLKTYRENR